MHNVLVTGATGFIGSCLVRRLHADGCAIRTVSRGRAAASLPHGVERLEGDVRDRGAMAHAVEGIDTVFHLAGRAHIFTDRAGQCGDEHEAITVGGTRNLLEAAQAAGVGRFVFFSSVKALADRSSSAALDESTPEAPGTSYGAARLAAERLVLSAGRTSTMHVVCLRLPMVWGPGSTGNLTRMLAAIDRERFPPLPDVPNRRSLVHVDDVVEAACLAATESAANGQVYIVTDGRAYSGRELYVLLRQSLGKPMPRWAMPAPVLTFMARVGDAIGALRGKPFSFDSDALDKILGSACYSSAKISRELGYRPAVPLDAGLPAFVEWYRRGRT